LNPYKTIWNEMILKSDFEFSCKSKTIVHDFTSKVHYYMCGVYLLNFIIMYIFLFKLAIIVHNLFFHINDFTIHLWHFNKVHFAKIPKTQKMSHLILQLTYCFNSLYHTELLFWFLIELLKFQFFVTYHIVVSIYHWIGFSILI